MRPLDDVHIIGSEILALPTISMFKHSSTSQQDMNSAILDNSSVIVRGSMIGSHCWQKMLSYLVKLASKLRSRVQPRHNRTSRLV